MRNIIMQYCSSVPNAVTEFDEKTHTGTVRVLNSDGKCSGTVQLFMIDSGLAFDTFVFNSGDDVILSADAGKLANLPTERIKISYCIKGRCETTMVDDRQFYISGGEIAINCGKPAKKMRIFSGDFEGFQCVAFLNSKWHEKMRDYNNSESAPEKIYKRIKSRNEPMIITADKKMAEIAKEIISCAEESKFDMISVKVMELMILISNGNTEADGLERKYYTNTQIEIARQTRDIICKDLSVRHSAKELAARFGISETSLKSYFRGYFGVGYHEYQNNVRMGMAANLLENTSLKVLEISLKVGFRSQTKFGICFKKYFGMNPLEYRRRAKLKQ